MAEVQSFLLDDDTANIQQFVVDKSSMRVDDPVNHLHIMRQENLSV